MKESLPIVISVVSLGVALFTLYRVELRGPNVKLRLLDAPGWSLNGTWLDYVTDQEGVSSPDKAKRCWHQLSGRFSFIIENTGSRTGILHGATVTIENLPEGFNILPGNLHDTFTIPGKSTVSLAPQVTLDRTFATAVSALQTYRGIERDLIVRLNYQVSRSLGRIVKDQTEIPVSKQTFTEPVERWAKTLGA